MRLDEKARENLEAAERLLPDDAGEREGLLNAAASRAYYAAYLAIADRALRSGHGFTSDGDDYFRHDRLPDDAQRWGLLDEDGRDDLEILYQCRVKADYYEDNVDLDEGSAAWERARRIVFLMLDGSAR